MRKFLTALALLTIPASARASDPAPVPLTRAEMKRQLEESKGDKPRLKAPEPTAEGLKSSTVGTEGVRGLLPPELRDGFSFFMTDGRLMEMSQFALRNPGAPAPPASRPARSPRLERDPNMTMEWAFRTMIFWVVSRSNNCIYCMGHQESSLPVVGVTEDRLAALDGDWSEFTLAERAAFGLARKLTVAPHTITDADIDAARRHYTDLQVLEITSLVAGFNAMNRWTGPLRLPQEGFRSFLTETSPRYASKITQVGPIPAGAAGARCNPVAAPRPAPESRQVVESRWAEARGRRARFPLVAEAEARAILPAATFPAGTPVPNWARLLANFPKAGPAKVAQLRISETKGNLPAKLKAQLAWASACADRAWYALACARNRLRALGVDDDTIFAIDEPSGTTFSPGEVAAFGFARKLTVDPALIDDSDFDALRKFYGESEIAELVFHVNHAVFFNLLTEAAALPLDGGSVGAVSRR